MLLRPIITLSYQVLDEITLVIFHNEQKPPDHIFLFDET